MHGMYRSRGFTLLEIMVALVVLAIGMLGLSRLSIANIDINVTNKNALIASVLLQDHMESIKQAGYARATNPSTTEDYGQVPDSNGSFDTYRPYKRVTSIALNTPATNIKTVTVTVYWGRDKYSLSGSMILGQ